MTEPFKHPYNDDSGRFELVAELYAAGYSWGIACVWRDTTTGRLYGDTDGGCSCYGPFEECGWAGLGQLTEVTTRADAQALADEVHGEDGVSTPERQDFSRAVEVALSKGRA